jgi:hypothetical protein
MSRSRWSLEHFKLLMCAVFVFGGLCDAAAQNPDALSPFFEGKQVVVKMDMPGTQKGVDIYPGRPQPLDVKSYAERLKDYGISLQKGDSVMVTKVKVNKDNIEFQLGGGGFGTARDNTDTTVHFTPANKSDREKELEDQLRDETDPDRRRSLQRELDYVRSERERRDRIDRARAENDAARREQQVGISRQQGGSRFNIRLDAKNMGDSLTPQVVEDALAQYVSFPGDMHQTATAPPSAPSTLVARPADQPADSAQGLKKGMTREQVETMYGKAVESHDHSVNGMTVTSCVFRGKDASVQADFVNGVLVQYQLSSY